MDREQAYDKISDYDWKLDKDCDIIIVGKGMYGEAAHHILSLVATNNELAKATYTALDTFLGIEDETWQINGYVGQLEDSINEAFDYPYQGFDMSDPDSWANWFYNQVDNARQWLADELDEARAEAANAEEAASDWESKYYDESSENDDLRERVHDLEEEVDSLVERIAELEDELEETKNAIDTGCDEAP